MLLDGRLDMSPVSSFHWAKHADQLALLPELCIGARNEVWSVVCVSRKPLAELGGATIAVTRESASGRNLLRVLLERRYGITAHFVDSADPFAAAARGEPALLIGDRAIDAQQTFAQASVHDLGKYWHEWTGADMVFAVWAVRRDVFAQYPAEVQAALDALVASQRWGAAHMERVVATAQATLPRDPGYYAAYYETLNFSLDARARAGLLRYAEELFALGAIPALPSVDPEVLVVTR
jgi:chorismate dehydratase